MQHVYWDVETFSQASLKDRGAYTYATDKTTDIFFFCYAVDAGEVQTWYPDDPVPAPLASPADFLFVSDNFTFERAIHENILVRRYGFPSIPLENTDCAERRALAASYPAELGLRCEALWLPFRKDPEARKAMMRLARPQTKKKQSERPADPAQRERDLVLLLERCKDDVEAMRACYNDPRLPPLLPEERELLLLDARINARGIAASIPFLEAARTLAFTERNAINTRIAQLTAGVITSVDQVQKIREAVNACGQDLGSLVKGSVTAALAHQPEGFVRELLTLRQSGAYASTRKYKRLLEVADPVDHRIRDALRIYGAGPGRWSSVGTGQLQNLPRNELPASLIDAVIAGDRAALANWGNPLQVVSAISRAALCAASGQNLVCAEDITTALAKWRWFLVIDRNTSFTYRNRVVDPRQIGNELGVRYLLGGSVRLSKQRLRISAQLLEAATDAEIWADRFDGEIRDVFALQDGLSDAIVAAIEPQLRSAELRRIRHKRPEDLSAYDSLLRALWHLYALNPNALGEALRLLSRALELEPTYAAAAALAAFCHRMRRQQGWSPSRLDETLGMQFAERALDCDPEDPFVLWTAGHAITALGKDHARARVLLDKSLALNPNCAQAWAASGWQRDHTSDRMAALSDFHRALRLSPFDPMNFFVLAGISCTYMNSRQYEKALEFGWKSIHEKKNYATSWRSVAVSLAYLGQRKEALAAVHRLREIDPDLTVSMVEQARCNLTDRHERQHYLDGLRLAGLPVS